MCARRRKLATLPLVRAACPIALDLRLWLHQKAHSGSGTSCACPSATPQGLGAWQRESSGSVPPMCHAHAWLGRAAQRLPVHFSACPMGPMGPTVGTARPAGRPGGSARPDAGARCAMAASRGAGRRPGRAHRMQYDPLSPRCHAAQGPNAVRGTRASHRQRIGKAGARGARICPPPRQEVADHVHDPPPERQRVPRAAGAARFFSAPPPNFLWSIDVLLGP